jgi:hypothetical protein
MYGREQKSWLWISRSVKPRMSVLAKASNNLTDRPTDLANDQLLGLNIERGWE